MLVDLDLCGFSTVFLVQSLSERLSLQWWSCEAEVEWSTSHQKIAGLVPGLPARSGVKVSLSWWL